MRRTGGWIVEHLNGLRILGVVVAGLFLVFGGNLTGWGLLVIVIVLAVYLGLLQLVGAWARRVGRRPAPGRRSRRDRDRSTERPAGLSPGSFPDGPWSLRGRGEPSHWHQQQMSVAVRRTAVDQVGRAGDSDGR